MPRVALVTGGAQGLGEAIALKLAEEGLDVAVADIAQKEGQLEAVANAIRAKGRRAAFFTGDVTKEADVVAIVSGTAEALGGLDVMVANAGLFNVGPIIDLDVEKWDQLHAVNVKGVFLQVKHSAKQMIKQGKGGVIIPASSLAGKSGYANLSMYCASKFAVRAITQSASKELAPHNITVIAYAPGFIKTPMITFPEDAQLGDYMTVKRRLGLPDEFAVDEIDLIEQLIAFMISPEAKKRSGEAITFVDGKLVTDV